MYRLSHATHYRYKDKIYIGAILPWGALVFGPSFWGVPHIQTYPEGAIRDLGTEEFNKETTVRTHGRDKL